MTTHHNSVFWKLIISLGFCCPFSFITAIRGRQHTHDLVSSELGISNRALRNWRYKVRDGECKCENNTLCHLRKFGDIEKIDPRSLRKRAVNVRVDLPVSPGTRNSR